MTALEPWEEAKTRLERRGLLSEVEKVVVTTGVPIEILLGRAKCRSVREARRMLYASLRAKHLSLLEIGELLLRDHTSILYGLRPLGQKKRGGGLAGDEPIPVPPEALTALVARDYQRVNDLLSVNDESRVRREERTACIVEIRVFMGERIATARAKSRHEGLSTLWDAERENLIIEKLIGRLTRPELAK